MTYKGPNALQICVTLAGVEPPIWRRLIVPWTWDLNQLHLVIQAAFNWWDYHLHEYNIGGLRYGDPEYDEGGFEDSARLFDEREVRLLDFGREPNLTFNYVYDLGDFWEHIVQIEQLLALDTIPTFASCTDGARARPPEDVGGTHGYEGFLTVIADRNDPEYADTKRWCGGHFDPEWFDLILTNKDVRNALRPNVKRRLYQPKPRRADLSH